MTDVFDSPTSFAVHTRKDDTGVSRRYTLTDTGLTEEWWTEGKGNTTLYHATFIPYEELDMLTLMNESRRL